MKHKIYVKPKANVRKLNVSLLNTVSGSDQPWGGKAKGNSSIFQTSNTESYDLDWLLDDL